MDWQWMWWLGGALVLGVIEMMTVDFTFLMLAAGALAATIAAAVGAPWWVSVIVFVVVSIVMLATVRPVMISAFRGKGQDTAVTGTAALVGKTAEAVTAIDDQGGRAKVEGEVWTARTEGSTVISPGTALRVIRIDGATAVVEAAADEEN